MTMERRLGPLAQPYHEGDALRYRRLSRVLTAAGAGWSPSRGAARGRPPWPGPRLALGGGAARRWSVFKAGIASALDPAYTVGPQRARIGGARWG